MILARDHQQILLSILGEYKQFDNFFCPGNHQETYGCLMISGRIEVN